MSGEANVFVGCSGPFDDARKDITIYIVLISCESCNPKRGQTTYRLPERKENDQLDTQDLEERPVLRQIHFQLQIELNQAEHRHCN